MAMYIGKLKPMATNIKHSSHVGMKCQYRHDCHYRMDLRHLMQSKKLAYNLPSGNVLYTKCVSQSMIHLHT